MPKKYELYHTLNSNLQNNDLKKKEKEEIINQINFLDKESMEAIFLLIYEHFRLNSDNTELYVIPYEGQSCNNNLIFNISKLPIKLRRIIYNFIKILQQKNDL